MQVQINLASRPFVELRPFFLRLRLLMAALIVVGVGLAVGAHILSARAERQQSALDRLRNQTIAVQQSRIHTEQRMRDPVNARVLDRAHFLNTLFLRKSFSWTAVMMDLENVLPSGVQVTSIEPQVVADGSVIIRLRVAGERANAIQLVRNLERSRRFLQPRLVGEAAQAKETAAGGQRPAAPTGPPGVEFEILADYNPLPPGEVYAAERGHAGVQGRPDRSAGGLEVTGIPVIHPSRRQPRAGTAAAPRAGYPRDGVVLRPYADRPAQATASSPRGPQ